MKLKNIPLHYSYLFRGKGISFFRKIRLMKQKRYVPFEMKFFGKKIKVIDSASFRGVYNELIVEEHYKLNYNENEAIRIIDCGANLGIASIYLKKQYPNAKITAIEADPNIAQYLSYNLNSFGFDDIKVLAKAVWTHNETLQFAQENGTSGSIHKQEAGKKVVTVPAIRLKDILEAETKIHFLKIDIEGAEDAVLKDCANSLGNVENLFLEYHSIHDKQQGLAEIIAILEQAGFRYHIKEAYTTEYPFIERKLQLNMDLQLNIFAYKTPT
ncbi:MAG: FkbM family methyltransferase [Saprospiraceae bacterium]|nr:FkbM family methyltransferase [Saprospiraceae bacterium]